MKKIAITLLGVVVGIGFASTGNAQRGGGAKSVNLPKGPARQVILKSCTTCHGLDSYAKYALDRTGWEKKVDSMKAKGATISDADEAILLDYLVDTFGPNAAAAVDVAALPPPTPEEAARAKQILQKSCTSCHTLQRVDDSIQTPDQWENTISAMRARGSDMTDEEAAFVASYLGRANIQK